jgi:hypothetical protein
MRRPKATQVSAAAKDALRLDDAEHAAAGAVLAADMVLLATVQAEVERAEEILGEVLDQTPAGGLMTLPAIGVVRASNYGASLGDPHRFRNAAAAYRFAGLVPTDYESAGRRRRGQHISREGSVELREAIIELGRGLAGHDSDFATYKANKLADGKKRSIAAVAVDRRAHRLAFAMMRGQTRYDPGHWAEAVAAGRSVMAQPGTGQPQRRDLPTAVSHLGPPQQQRQHPDRVQLPVDGSVAGARRNIEPVTRPLGPRP